MICDKRIAIKFRLAVLFCVYILGNAEIKCIERERDALLSFKDGFIDDSNLLSSWQSDECCEWYGVGCDTTTGHVITLQLISPRLRGKIGPSLLELHHLNFLELSRIDFGGIPIPEFIGSMKQLQYLRLRRSNFSGSIPPQLGNLTNLRSLVLSSNSLTSIPLSISQLSKLQTLELSSNSFLYIAPDLSPSFQLKRLSLAWCNVGPYFPKWIRTQRSLSYLDLSGSNITDEAPMWLWSSSILETLDLSNNQISGTIPNLTSTSILAMDLSYNQFSGPIPLFPTYASIIDLSANMFSGSISSVFKTDKLSFLDLSNNLLEGDVPNSWEKMPLLYSLNLANNNFSGEIPHSLGTLRFLLALQLHGNNLYGELPYNLSLCQDLSFMDVGGNKLTGEIPTWIGRMHKMQFLNFRRNKLHGSIPPQICNLTNIQVLDLSINKLFGIVPDCFNSFTALASKNPTVLDPFLFGMFAINENKLYGYSSFQWKGQELEYRKNLELLKLIDFSSNRLIGTIPRSFSNMSGLYSLNLSRNSFSGYIIPDIGKIEMLNSLDLSHNQLTGKIPTSLAAIYTLGVLDLSNNHLSGKIPSSTQLQSFNASVYAGNDGLCGDPLPKCLEDRLRPSTTNPVENINEKEGNIFSFMQEVGISMGFGFIFGFWGVVGSFILKKSWRIAFFNLMDAAGDWIYVRIAVFVSNWRRN